MFGNFSEEALEVWEFARCQREDGTYYGSRGKCKKGKEVAAEEEEESSGFKYLTVDSLKDPEVKKAAKALLKAKEKYGAFDTEKIEEKRQDLVDLLEPDDADEYDALQREIDEIFFPEFL